MRDRSEVSEIRPPARLGAILFAMLMAALAAVWLSARADVERSHTALRSRLDQRHLEALGHRTAGSLRLAVALSDRELADQISRELIRDDESLDGVTVVFSDGQQLTTGDTTGHTHLVELGTLTPSADLLDLGDWPLELVAAQTGASVQVHAVDPSGFAAVTRGPGFQPWALAAALGTCLLVFSAFAAWQRRRVVRLGELAAAIVNGDADPGRELGGWDELGWVGRQLSDLRAVFHQQVERVHGRNASLLRDVAVQHDRLERMDRFASELVAPVSERLSLTPALDRLVGEADAVMGLLFVPREKGLRCIAVSGFGESVDLGSLPAAAAARATEATEALSESSELGPEHPWMRAAQRQVPLRGLTAVPIRFRERLEGVLALVTREPMRAEDLAFVGDAARPLAIAMANHSAYQASVDLSSALESRNLELVRQRDELRSINRLRGEFVANMSHELRTPLNAIIGYSELLVDGIYGEINGDQRGALDTVEHAAKHLLTLVNQVLDLSCAESGHLSLEHAPVELRALVDDVVGMAAPLCRTRPYELRATGAPLEVETDAERVYQIVTNLVNNAIKFTEEGSVEVHIGPLPDGGAEIAVKDTGVGIDEEHMEIIFEQFRQVDGSSTRTHDGVGLGLAISRRIAEALGGSLSATSRPGAGSTFRLRLPARPPSSNEGTESSARERLAS